MLPAMIIFSQEGTSKQWWHSRVDVFHLMNKQEKPKGAMHNQATWTQSTIKLHWMIWMIWGWVLKDIPAVMSQWCLGKLMVLILIMHIYHHKLTTPMINMLITLRYIVISNQQQRNQSLPEHMECSMEIGWAWIRASTIARLIQIMMIHIKPSKALNFKIRILIREMNPNNSI